MISACLLTQDLRVISEGSHDLSQIILQVMPFFMHLQSSRPGLSNRVGMVIDNIGLYDDILVFTFLTS